MIQRLVGKRNKFGLTRDGRLQSRYSKRNRDFSIFPTKPFDFLTYSFGGFSGLCLIRFRQDHNKLLASVPGHKVRIARTF